MTIISFVLLSFVLCIYMIVNLQWYSYKISRVFLKHHKYIWHIYYLFIPLLFALLLSEYLFALLLVYIGVFYLWYKKIDKKLLLTSRVKRYFFFVLFFSVLFLAQLFYLSFVDIRFMPIFVLIFSIVSMNIYEYFELRKFKNMARAKLDSMDKLIIIQITASYAKTSIKNFLYACLKNDFNVAKTPKSVNTLVGIIRDINENLPLNTQIYIVESGARNIGDIKQISTFLNPQYVILGSIGEAHIEYFKTFENIVNTKKEILLSNNLKKAYIHIDNKQYIQEKQNFQIQYCPDDLHIITNTLDKVEFSLKIQKQENFQTQLLGSLNPQNLSFAIRVAYDLDVEISTLKQIVQNMPFVKHRLQKIQNGQKLILDDSYNSNFNGMSEAIKVCSTYKNGKKIIVTCGLVESSKELNIAIAKKIDEVFDIVIVTSSLNVNIFKNNIKRSEIVVLEDKEKLQEILKQKTTNNDLVLFANDAPNYI